MTLEVGIPDAVDDASPAVKPARGSCGVDRRGFFRTLGVVGAGLALANETSAGANGARDEGSADDPWGVLVDTTQCVGCRTCEKECAKAHGLPVPEGGYRTVTAPEQLSIVQHHESSDPRVDMGVVFVKRQCMHCLQPACASACLTKALLKTADGPVVWRGSKCMGCRYCMVSCPFDMPKAEYDSAAPRIMKCDLCADRVAEGKQPVCVESCGASALTFGRRSALIEEAHKRIADSPDVYVHHIYGEREAGGTSWLYLAATEFDKLGFEPDLERVTYPSLTKEFLYGVPVILTLVPPLLLAMSNATRPAFAPEHGAEGGDHGSH
ncbi:MAG: 4Fe-4S dicluster domain-containing protein [Planctomycetes bacterium]|nr:4Fe-4S dicluster domain-containing protein [Planctomycetota bacterium]